jgi:formate-dependent nitrite reductase membrane component NrfD
MNLFVADPHWGWWIILYFFFGGIAAGAYFVATLVALFGSPEDRPISRIGYRLAFPLIVLCGVLLIVDLNRPERFWHMLVKSEVVREAIREGWPWSGPSWALMASAPLFKHWSPMSIGSWALSLFGLCSLLSYLGTLRPEGRVARWLNEGVLARVIQVVGCLVGFFIASYTGALLTATSQPIWSQSTWIAPLFLTSAASTGIAALLLLSHGCIPAAGVHRLEAADRWALLLEAVVFAVFLASLGRVLGVVLSVWQGVLLVVVVPVVGVLGPLLLQRRTPLGVAALALIGGFALRYAILATPPRLLDQDDLAQVGASTSAQAVQDAGPLPTGFFRISPEESRMPPQAGADPGNRPAEFQPRSKVFHEP